MKKSLLCSLLFLLLLLSLPARATHIVGADMTYTCLPNNTYRIRLDIFQDCLTGDISAIQMDNPAFIGIYDGNGIMVLSDTAMYASGPPVLVPPNFRNECVNNPPNTCLQRTTFIKDYILPPNATGYKVVYQRCCRNGTIVNIINPGAVGATYYCIIPPATEACNNSAVFKNFPPQVICINNPLLYDHSATDPDGDSLSYEFCQAYVGGNPNNAKPYPPPTIGSSFVPVQYIPPYTFLRPMAGNPLVQINPSNGMISGTPNITGRFVVTVCCNEWRNGVLINTVKREFQFVVTNCSKAVVANIPQFSNEFNTYIVECRSNTVRFVNRSTGGFAYHWDFGVPGTDADTSTEFEPTFTYPDTGIYTVKLVVNRGSTCPDSISRSVKIYPTFETKFSVSGAQCPGKPIQFIDQSEATYGPVSSWLWNFGDGNTSDQQNPVHIYPNGGQYDVTLISQSIKGCTDTLNKLLDVEQFRPFAGNDTIIVKGERINFRASGGITYTWTPATNLSDPNIGNPVGYYPDTGVYAYNVHIRSPFGCEADDSIRVWVVGQSSVFVPSGFSPNGDGRNDVFKPIGIGYRNINYFRVFDRWGAQVFYTTRFDEGWDGRNRGRPAEIGTYFWVLSMTDRFGREELLKGDVTLIR